MINKKLLPGTIVKSHYGKMTNGRSTVDDIGIFCVIYDEGLDKTIHHKQNIVALKITTSLEAIGTYSVFLKAKGRNSFLERDSFCQCSKLHTLNKASQVYAVLGRLDDKTVIQIKQELEAWTSQMLSQVSYSIKKGGSYEPLYKKSFGTPRLSSRLYGSRVRSRQSSRKF